MPTQLDLNDPKQISALFKTAREYRERNFEDVWKEVIQYDEEYSPNRRFPILGQGGAKDRLRFVVRLPKIRLNNQRKAAMLGRVKFVPKVYSESTTMDGAASVRELLLAWAFRVSRFDSLVASMNRDIVSLGTPFLQGVWDQDALGGEGAPAGLVKDCWSMYVDPQRRHTDINKDCRWIFDCQWYTASDLYTMWSDYFDQHEMKGGYSQGTFSLDQSTFKEQHSDAEGELYPIAAVEYMTRENNRKIIKRGILDIGGNEWIEPAQDNELGMYSYAPFSVKLRRKHAWPIPPNAQEFETCDLLNATYSLAMQGTYTAVIPHIIYDAEDTFQIEMFKSDKYGDPGAAFGVGSGYKGPRTFEGVDIRPLFEIAMNLERQTNENSTISQIQRGEAPTGVQSGRAIQLLQGHADITQDEYNAARDEGAAIFANIIDRLCQKHITGFREITVSQGNNTTRVPLNVPPDHPQFGQLDQDQNVPTVKSARWFAQQPMEGQPPPEMMSGSLQEAQGRPFLEILNDIKSGKLEIGIDAIPDRGPDEKWARVSGLVLMGQQMQQPLVGPHFILNESGVENPDGVLQEADQRNQVLQAGQMFMQSPVLQAVAQSPELQNIVLGLMQAHQNPQPENGKTPKGQPKPVQTKRKK